MQTETVINKVVVTAEAQFDYKCELGIEMPIDEIKESVEDYIDFYLSRFSGYYFRVKYLDEVTDRMLLLFVYKDERYGETQWWDIRGVCQVEDWSEELEESGQIREWLYSTVIPEKNEPDWVWDLRIKEAMRRKELAEEYGEEVEDNMPEIKEMLKNYKLNKARIAVGDSQEINDLKAEMEFLDRCIDQLDDEAMAVITLLYRQGLSMSRIGRKLGYTKQAISKKRDRALAILAILFADRVK